MCGDGFSTTHCQYWSSRDNLFGHYTNGGSADGGSFKDGHNGAIAVDAFFTLEAKRSKAVCGYSVGPNVFFGGFIAESVCFGIDSTRLDRFFSHSNSFANVATALSGWTTASCDDNFGEHGLYGQRLSASTDRFTS